MQAYFTFCGNVNELKFERFDTMLIFFIGNDCLDKMCVRL